MSLTDRRILVVEDEYFLAQNLLAELEEAGAVVIGPEATVADALQRIGVEPWIDAAVLDVNLAGEEAFPIADLLLTRAIPFVFASGYDAGLITLRYPGVVNCTKPFVFRHIKRSLEAVLH